MKWCSMIRFLVLIKSMNGIVKAINYIEKQKLGDKDTKAIEAILRTEKRSNLKANISK